MLSLALRTAIRFGYCQPFSDPVGPVREADASIKPGFLRSSGQREWTKSLLLYQLS